jgi:hypothetical protein
MTDLEPVIHAKTKLDGRVKPGHGEEFETSAFPLKTEKALGFWVAGSRCGPRGLAARP